MHHTILIHDLVFHSWYPHTGRASMRKLYSTQRIMALGKKYQIMHAQENDIERCLFGPEYLKTTA
jgi:hypothetical protein